MTQRVEPLSRIDLPVCSNRVIDFSREAQGRSSAASTSRCLRNDASSGGKRPPSARKPSAT
jgi:hypothetical protein